MEQNYETVVVPQSESSEVKFTQNDIKKLPSFMKKALKQAKSDIKTVEHRRKKK